MRSMTGYSKEYFENDDYSLLLEIKSVNNKNLNLKIKMPSVLNFLENKIRTVVATKVTRGSLDLRIEFQDKRQIEQMYILDNAKIQAYLTVLRELEKETGEKILNPIDILLKNVDAIKINKKNSDDEIYSHFIIKNLFELLDGFVEMKLSEGQRMKDYIYTQINIIKNNIEKIKNLKELVVDIYKNKLLQRLSKLTEMKFDDANLLKEILLFTDKSDISEEVSRLESHICQLEIEINKEDMSLGKKIDFILQEIFRELNTLGVKSNLYDISKIVVECKNEVEKIREQALNIE